MRRSASDDTVNWQKTSSNCAKLLHHVFDDHQFKQQEMETVGELSRVCSQTVVKFLYLARIGRPDNLFDCELGVLIRAPRKKDYSYLCTWMTSNFRWKERKHQSDVEGTQQRSRFAKAISIP